MRKWFSLKRIGWLYPIFRDLHFYHGLLDLLCCFVSRVCRGVWHIERPAIAEREFPIEAKMFSTWIRLDEDL